MDQWEFTEVLEDCLSTDSDVVDQAQDDLIRMIEEFEDDHGLPSLDRRKNVDAFLNNLNGSANLAGNPLIVRAVLDAIAGNALSSVCRQEVSKVVSAMNAQAATKSNAISNAMSQMNQQVQQQINSVRNNSYKTKGGMNSMPDALISKLDVNTTVTEFEGLLSNSNITFSKVIGMTGQSALSRTGYKYSLTDSQGTSAVLQLFVSPTDQNVLELRNIRFRSGSFFEPILPDVIDIFVGLAKVNKGSVAAYAGGYSYLVEKGNDISAKLAVVPASFDTGELTEDQATSTPPDESIVSTKFFIKDFIAQRPDLKQSIAMMGTQEEKANAVCDRVIQERKNNMITGYETSDILYQCKLLGMTNPTGLTLINITRD